jgi:hypothetical protein
MRRRKTKKKKKNKKEKKALKFKQIWLTVSTDV